MIKLSHFNFWQTVVHYLPKKILYYAFVKVLSEMSTGKFARVNVTEMKAVDVLKAFKDHHKIGV